MSSVSPWPYTATKKSSRTARSITTSTTSPPSASPYWLGYVSAFTEFIGGMLLIIGFLTRLAAALIAINMLVAFFFVGIHQGAGTYNYILALVALAIMLTFYGAGALALDRKLGFA